MKHYVDPELELVSFDTKDVTNFGGGDNPDIPADDLSDPNAKFFFFGAQW